jgi:uncharacterized protein (DUF362 family)
MKRLGRREFCAGLGALACWPACRQAPESAALLPDAQPPAALTLSEQGSGLGRVIEARWAAAVDAAGRVDASRVREMLGAALQRLTGSERPFERWAGPTRRVSIKVNSVTSQAFTHPELAEALARGLVGAGCEPQRVAVWDRDGAGLRARGYRLDPAGTRGYRCLGSDGTPPGPRQSASIAGATVHFSPLLGDSDLLFSVAALKDHSMAGVTLSLKNNFGTIYGADLLHGDVRRGSACEPAISELAARPEIRDRLQLAVIDALVGVCHGGPGPAAPQHAFRYGGLLLGYDPVAVDRAGLAIIEARRARLGLVPLAQRTHPNPAPPIHIDNAAARGVSPA